VSCIEKGRFFCRVTVIGDVLLGGYFCLAFRTGNGLGAGTFAFNTGAAVLNGSGTAFVESFGINTLALIGDVGTEKFCLKLGLIDFGASGRIRPGAVEVGI
jgi:hypothetical protein